MKQLIIFILVFFISISDAFAQMKRLDNISDFVKQFEQNLSAIKSLECDFMQITHKNAFNRDIHSSGKFNYKAGDKITLKYIMPAPYSVEIKGDTVKMEYNGRKTIMNMKDNKMLKEMNNILTSCMTGIFRSLLKDYQVDFFENEQLYLLTFKPINEDIKKNITQFDMYLNNKEMSLDKFRIYETEGDYTEYKFKNKKINTPQNQKSQK